MYTVPTGFDALPPSGPAIPVTETARSTPLTPQGTTCHLFRHLRAHGTMNLKGLRCDL